jgi:DNA-binding beta-propeller fold protein YncE
VTWGGEVAIIDGATDSVIAVVDAGSSDLPGICYNAANNRIYSLDADANTVAVIDGAADRLLRHIPVPEWPQLIGCNAVNNKIYVAAGEEMLQIVVIDGVLDTVVRLLPASGYAESEWGGFCHNLTSNKVFFVGGEQEIPYVTVIDGATSSVIGLFDAGPDPAALAWNSLNNRVYCANYSGSSISVYADVGSGPRQEWVARAPVPDGPKTRKVKDGGALAALDAGGDGFVYGFKGNNTCEFYRYNCNANSWLTLESIPAAGSLGRKKTVKKGAALTAGGGRLYGFKGNNTNEFWQYTPGLGWFQLPDAPGSRTLKDGTGAAAVDYGGAVSVYLLKGAGTQEFLRYSTVG